MWKIVALKSDVAFLESVHEDVSVVPVFLWAGGCSSFTWLFFSLSGIDHPIDYEIICRHRVVKIVVCDVWGGSLCLISCWFRIRNAPVPEKVSWFFLQSVWLFFVFWWHRGFLIGTPSSKTLCRRILVGFSSFLIQTFLILPATSFFLGGLDSPFDSFAVLFALWYILGPVSTSIMMSSLGKMGSLMAKRKALVE